MTKYNIVAPTGRVFGTATSYGEACETMVSLTLQWGAQFGVVPVGKGEVAFSRERQLVTQRAMEYMTLQRDYPDSDQAKIAALGLTSAKKRLERLLMIKAENTGTSERTQTRYEGAE